MLHPYKVTIKEFIEPSSPPKSVLCIVNPFSGKKKGLEALNRFKSVLEGANVNVKVIKTTHAGHCGEICQAENLEGIDVVAPIGGDGTVHEAVNGLLKRSDDEIKRVILVVVPAGSGNTFAFDLGISSPEHSAKLILNSKYRIIDVAKLTAIDEQRNKLVDVEPIYSVNMIGWALASKVMKTANSYRRYGLGAQYNLAIYKYILSNDRYKVKLTYLNESGDELKKEGAVAVLNIQNTVHIGSKTPLIPKALIDDGFLDMVIMENRGVLTNIKTFNLSQQGKHTERKQISFEKVQKVYLEPSDERLRGRNTVNIDGELIGYSPCLIEVCPAALKVFSSS